MDIQKINSVNNKENVDMLLNIEQQPIQLKPCQSQQLLVTSTTLKYEPQNAWGQNSLQSQSHDFA